MEDASVRVVIPTYNSENTIAKCLEAVYTSSYKNFELVVVDDGSKDRTREVVKRYPCRLIESATNRGAASARNLGTKDCSSDFILFIDADVIVDRDTIKHLLGRIASEGVDAVIGSYAKSSLNSSFFSRCHNFFQYFYYFRKLVSKLPNSRANVFWTGCGLVKTKAFRDVGGFWEVIKGAYMEDDIFGYELTKKGYSIYIDQDAIVCHDHRYNFFELMMNYFKRAIRTTQTLFISRADSLASQSYFNLQNFIALIFSFIFISALAASFIIDGIFRFIALFAFLFFLLVKIDFYFFILKETTLPFTAFSVLTTLCCYIAAGMGIFIGIVLGIRSKLLKIYPSANK